MSDEPAKKRVLYTGGTFDLFHYGHINFLRQCSHLADEVIVALNLDGFIAKFKGSPPIMTYEEREKSLLNCEYVSAVVPNLSGEDSKQTIMKVNPHIIAIGDDWAKKDYYSQMQFTQEWIEKNGMVLVYIPYTGGISTTEIKQRILEGTSRK